MAQCFRWLLWFSLLHKKPCMGGLAANFLHGVQVPNTQTCVCSWTYTQRVNAAKVIFKSGDKTAIFHGLIISYSHWTFYLLTILLSYALAVIINWDNELEIIIWYISAAKKLFHYT